MYHIKTILLAIVCFCSFRSVAQQKYPNTLLWRITGNGLTRPSYLFGSMHLQDRRLFYFTDSVYSAIENTEGFAVEINPDEMSDMLLSKMDLNEKSNRIKDILSEKEYKKLKGQLEKKYKISADRLTAKDVTRYRQQKLYEQKKDDMPTFMDLYLYDIAKQQGKWTGGIEDVNDQMNVINEVGANITPEELADQDTVRIRSVVEQLKNIYIKEDLNQIASYYDYDQIANTSNADMIKRNHKMARRMDSISSIRSCFFAVGAAHLPGDSGVIRFLQDRGFTVLAVLSDKKIAPESYTYLHKEKEWISFSDDDEAYAVRMPGKPTLMSVQNVLPLNMYLDLSTVTAYGICAVAMDSAGENIIDKIELILAQYKSGGFIILDKKPIEVQGAKGIEVSSNLPNNGYYKMQFLGYENRMFLLIFGGQTKAAALSDAGKRFFNSFVINKISKPVNEQWKLFTDPQCGVHILFPGNIKLKPFLADENKGNYYKAYTCADLKEGSYYMLTINELGPGYYIRNDSETFDLYQKYFEKTMGLQILEKDLFNYKNYQACRFTGYKTDEKGSFSIQCIAVLRGNRTYQAWAIVPKEKKDFPEVTNFFRSLEFLPYGSIAWKNQGDDENKMTFYAPAPLVKVPDSTERGDDISFKYYSKDDVSATTFSLENKPLSKYFWIATDSAYWAKKLKVICKPEDSLLYKNISHTGNLTGADFAFAIAGTKLVKQLKYIFTADTSYCLYAYLSDEMYRDERVKKLFKEFTVTDSRPSEIFSDKTALVLHDLQSTDSLTRAAAVNALKTAAFSKTDLPALRQAFLRTYIYDSSNYKTINDDIGNAISVLNDSSTIEFIQNNYTDDNYESLRPKMIAMLARQKNSTSYTALKNLLLLHKTIKNDVGIAYLLYDSLSLSKNFFPESGILLKDSIIGPLMAALANRLVDSSIITIDMIRPNEENLEQLANHQYRSLSKKDKGGFESFTTNVIELLGKLNDSRSNAAVMPFAELKQLYVKQSAILTLLKNNVSVPAKEIHDVADDNASRVDFYEKLKGLKKEYLFPRELKTRQKFAASYAYNFLSDDDITITSLNYLQEKVNTADGNKSSYYLFKAITDEEDKPQLIIVGPFANNNTTFTLENSYDKVWVDEEPYVAAKLESAFRRMLKGSKKEVIEKE